MKIRIEKNDIKFDLTIEITSQNVFSNSFFVTTENLIWKNLKYIGNKKSVLKKTDSGYEITLPSEFMYALRQESIVFNIDEYSKEIESFVVSEKEKVLEEQLNVMRGDYVSNKVLQISYNDFNSFTINNVDFANSSYQNLVNTLNDKKEMLFKKYPKLLKNEVLEISFREIVRLTNFQN